MSWFGMVAIGSALEPESVVGAAGGLEDGSGEGKIISCVETGVEEG
jgi:hypothetical protein